MRSACSVQECGKPIKSQGLCSGHFYRLSRHGSPTGGKAFRGEVERFYREVVRAYEGDDCLIWPFAKSDTGYATMTADDKSVIVSRYLCRETHGEPPTPKHHAAHSCGKGKQGCVTKGHLSWKTKADNEADKLEHGTKARGERHGRSKLTEAQVKSIRSLKGKESSTVIATRFGISERHTKLILDGGSWSWL